MKRRVFSHGSRRNETASPPAPKSFLSLVEEFAAQLRTTQGMVDAAANTAHLLNGHAVLQPKRMADLQHAEVVSKARHRWPFGEDVLFYAMDLGAAPLWFVWRTSDGWFVRALSDAQKQRFFKLVEGAYP